MRRHTTQSLRIISRAGSRSADGGAEIYIYSGYCVTPAPRSQTSAGHGPVRGGKPMRSALALGRLAHKRTVSHCASGAVGINGAALAHKWCLRIKALWSVQRTDAPKRVKRTQARKCSDAHWCAKRGPAHGCARIRCALKKRKRADGCARKCDER